MAPKDFAAIFRPSSKKYRAKVDIRTVSVQADPPISKEHLG